MIIANLWKDDHQTYWRWRLNLITVRWSHATGFCCLNWVRSWQFMKYHAMYSFTIGLGSISIVFKVISFDGAESGRRRASQSENKVSFWKLTNDLLERYSSSLHEYLIDFDWTDRDIKKVYEQRKHMVKQMVKSIIFLGKFKVCFRNKNTAARLRHFFATKCQKHGISPKWLKIFEVKKCLR